MKLFGKLSDTPYALLAMATVAILPSHSSAQDKITAGQMADNLTGQIDSVGKLVVAGAGLIGVVLVGAGLMKLKQAADTQGQQVKYSEGLWRLVVGAGLVAIPAVTGMLTATMGLQSATVQMTELF